MKKQCNVILKWVPKTVTKPTEKFAFATSFKTLKTLGANKYFEIYERCDLDYETMIKKCG